MKIKDISFFPIAQKLKIPFHYFTSVINERKGFIIKCADELGNIGYGECSPLPGFSSETLDEAENELKRVISELRTINIVDNFSSLESTLLKRSNIASVQFGIEQALLNLSVIRNPSFLLANFANTNSSINVNTVIGMDDIESVLTKVKTKVLNGYKTVKLKIGRDDPFDDFYIIVTLRDIIGYDFKLRLDANKKWSADEAIEYLNRLQEYNIEYVEEPCEFVPSTFRTVEETRIPVALDESIESFEQADELIKSSNIPFIIIKPMILGSIFASARLIKEAELQNKVIIISSSFESAVGKSGLVLLSSLANPDFAHGLGTSEFFEQDICIDPYPVVNGQIQFDVSSYPPKFNFQ